MCSPRGVIAEFAKLQEAIMQAGGAQGETRYWEILRRHGAETPSHFRSSQPARLCAKELFQAIQTFEQPRSGADSSSAELVASAIPQVAGAADQEGGKQDVD
jgi:hypothetical protein